MKKVITCNFSTVNVLTSFFLLFTFELNHVLSFPGSACYYAEVLGLLVQDFFSIFFGFFSFPTDQQTQNEEGVDKTWALAHGLPYGLPCGLPYFDDFIISQ